MSSPPNDVSVPEIWHGKPKGVKAVLRGRGLWPENDIFGLDCKTQHDKPDRNIKVLNAAGHILSLQLDSNSQKSILHAVIEEQDISVFSIQRTTVSGTGLNTVAVG